MSQTHYKPRLTIYVVWHPDYDQGQRFANYLYSWLTRDVRNPVSRRIGIPIFFRNMSDAKSGAPLPIPFDDSHHTAVVALVDDHLVASDAWDSYLGTLWEKTQSPNSPHRLFPVSISPYSFNLYSDVPEANFIRLHDLDEERRPAVLARSLTHELCRLLLAQERTVVSSETGVSFAPVKLFFEPCQTRRIGYCGNIFAIICTVKPRSSPFLTRMILRRVIRLPRKSKRKSRMRSC